MKKRYAIAGVGVRSLCFAKSLLNDHWDCTEIAAFFDNNPLRMKGFNELLKTDIPCFTDFAEMVEVGNPTHLIIGTPDYTHDEFIELAFANNLDVICEKPMATTAGKVRRILDLEKQFGRKIIVSFNYRYIPYVAKIKEIIQSGVIGKVLSVTLDWHLDRAHGPEYFRRWHANMKNSGGLFVHKATHHFDLVNWFLNDEPQDVAAFGALNVFGGESTFRGERCSTCSHAGGECPFEMKVHKIPGDKDIFDKLYWNAENADGYIRDRCLFSR
jgi:predicted dehydrogenase